MFKLDIFIFILRILWKEILHGQYVDSTLDGSLWSQNTKKKKWLILSNLAFNTDRYNQSKADGCWILFSETLGTFTEKCPMWKFPKLKIFIGCPCEIMKKIPSWIKKIYWLSCGLWKFAFCCLIRFFIQTINFILQTRKQIVNLLWGIQWEFINLFYPHAHDLKWH